MLIKTNLDAAAAMAAMQAGVCFACGRNDVLSSINTEGTAQNMGQFMACCNCILKYSRTQLAAEADRVLSVMTSPEWKRRASEVPDGAIYCRKCRKRIDRKDSRIVALLSENRIPLICFECFDELKALQERLGTAGN